MLQTLFNQLAIIISLSTATGVFIHDTHIDRAASTASAAAIAINHDGSAAVKAPSADLHPHTERGSLAQAISTLKSPTPSIKPRHEEDTRHLLPQHAVRGYHPFDNYVIPLE